ncbi:hypothetical protein SOCEGT47_072470 [Sorangium cellulosum]|uniref:Uncharacterized protein n=1 Tax=Sorangium cellulosum TaxID=56 RepID=A0A4P2QAI6_SORCE|nr:hypothetical protein [Sorangium cellulosum]AUX26677.1 hypothetical protein SOCEGT47_072470 [Sorangium cellulosum]
MNQDKIVYPLCGLALSSVLTTGCIIDVRDGRHPRPSDGSLTVEWTVSRRSSPRSCARFAGGAADFELLLYDEHNREVAREVAPCEDFGLTVDLPPGEYSGYATLVERRDDRPVTTTLPLEDLEIVSGAELNLDIDFPANSFL